MQGKVFVQTDQANTPAMLTSFLFSPFVMK